MLTNTVYYRDFNLQRDSLNEESRIINASLSSETAVERYWGKEILLHSKEAINLSRAKDGLPLLWNHDTNIPIGLVENITLDSDKKLRGQLRFSNNAKATEIWHDVKDGFLKNISIGYSIKNYTESRCDDGQGLLVTASEWEIAECSIVPVPADHTVGINRNFSFMENDTMANKEPQQTQLDDNQPATTVSAELPKIRRDLELIRQEARQQAINEERMRVADISEIFDNRIIPTNAEFRALRAQALDDGWTVDMTRKKVMEALSDVHYQEPQQQSNQRMPAESRATVTNTIKPAESTIIIQSGEDALDKFNRGVELAFDVRAGIDTSRDTIRKARESGFVGMRLSRMAEHYLQLVGIDTRNLNDDTLPQRALTTRASGATTSDFANLLANTANKSLMMGWDQAPETWQQWVRIGQVPDFKLATRTGLSGFTSLAAVPEDGEISYGKFTDRKETIQAVSYAKKFRLSYQAIKNDDLNAFTQIPRGMGRAAQSVIGDMVYSILNGTGPTLTQDSIALFNTATHKNYIASADAPSVTTLDAAFKAMALQSDPNNSRSLNIVPRFLIVPKALETTARVLNTSQYDPGATSSTKNQMTPNPFQNRVEVISDARLDSQTNGTTAWYLAADANRFDTIEVAFVDGIAEPYLREEQEWDTRGVEWVVGVDFGVAALDFRGLFKQKGAA